MKYGVQLFSLRKYLKDEQGYEKAFAECKRMGAQTVQLSGGKPIDPNFVKSLVSKYDMPVCITHDKFDRLENDLDGLIAEHKIYGCNNLGIGMMPKNSARENSKICKNSLTSSTLRQTASQKRV